MTAIRDAVRGFIVEQFLDDASADELTDQTPLISGGVLDSINTLKLVNFLETEFAIDIQAHEVGIDYLDTVDQISELVGSKKG
jgi:acyl carrier protein